MCGVAFFPAGQGKGKNPQGGAKVIIRVNRLVPKILQKWVKEKYNITYYDIN